MNFRVLNNDKYMLTRLKVLNVFQCASMLVKRSCMASCKYLNYIKYTCFCRIITVSCHMNCEAIYETFFELKRSCFDFIMQPSS